MSSITKSTELKIDYSLIPENIPALCVPYVFENIHEARIRGIFKDLDIGEVTQVDLVPYTATDGKRVNRVFVHLKWNTQESTNKVRTKLLCGREIKVVYDDPWFWSVSASRANKAPPREKKAPTKSRPRIEDDDDEEECVKPPRDHRAEREHRAEHRADHRADRDGERDIYRKSHTKPHPKQHPPRQQVAPRMPKQRVNLQPREDQDEYHHEDKFHEDAFAYNDDKFHEDAFAYHADKYHEDDAFVYHEKKEDEMSTHTSNSRRSNVLDVDDLIQSPFEYTNLVDASKLPTKKKVTKKRVLNLLNDDKRLY